MTGITAKKAIRVSARRDKEVFCINFAAPKMKTPAGGQVLVPLPEKVRRASAGLFQLSVPLRGT